MTEELTEARDKLEEHQMATLLGLSYRALQSRRLKGLIPFGVWNKVGRETVYSVRKYEEWLESIWDCPPAWSLPENRSESGSRGKGQHRPADAKPSTSRKHRKASQRPQLYVLK